MTDDGDEKAASKGQACKLWCQKHIFNKKTINKRLPITAWLPKYDRVDFLGDLVAGVTVGLTVIPQALAYAGIAGLDVKVSKQIYVYKTISVERKTIKPSHNLR